MKKITLFLFITLLSSNILFGQSFSKDKAKFPKELGKFLALYDGQLSREFMKEFEPMILTGQIPDAYFSKLVETCNLMESKKLKPYPEFYNYTFSVFSFVKTGQPAKSFHTWHESVDKMLDGRNLTKFKDFIGVCAKFFSENILNDSRTYLWRVRGGDYEFQYGKDGPEISFTNVTLTCHIINNDVNTKEEKPYKDSAVIYNTSGLFELQKERWVGQGGKVTWEKVGLPAKETFATLNNYRVSLKKTSYNCDTVTLITPYFTEPLQGALSEHTMNFAREIDKVFPQFNSFDKHLKIKDILPEVDYEGGFALKGASFVGVGSKTERANMTFYRDGRPFLKTSSQEVYIDEKLMITNNASVHLTLATKDSIFHPGANVTFFRDRDAVEINRGKTGVSQSPFINSYHKLEIYIDRIIWERKKQDLILKWGEGISQEQRIGRFESMDYYNGHLFDQLQGSSTVHPLVALNKYTFTNDVYLITEGEAASSLSQTTQQAKPLMLMLANYGFISYDTEAGMVEVLPKTRQFVNAKSANVDYDNIIFVTDMRPKRMGDYRAEEIERDPFLKQMSEKYEKENRERKLMQEFGKLNLATLEISLKAVERVTISDFQNTQVFPKNHEVIIKKNRDFIFKGWVNTGRWEINLQDGYYDYANNKINIIESDMSYIRVRPFQKEDGDKTIRTFTSITGLKGEILVDNPENRSGNKTEEFTDYPKLISKTQSKVFYNDKKIHRGSYDSLRFYFTVDPFVFDSLDNFVEKAARFGGEMTTGGIFPKFRDSLKIMPDYSLGFAQDAPKGGYEFYGTGSRYNNKIVLSNSGLQGSGEIQFVTTLAESKVYTFMPDSTVGFGNYTTTPRETGVQMPDAIGEDVLITYLPNGNVLKATTNVKPMRFFENEALFKGTAFVRPGGMTAKGTFDFKSVNMVSVTFKFERWNLKSDTTSFRLSDPTPGLHPDDALALQTENVQCDISFKDRKGQFKSNSNKSKMDFPITKYYCIIDRFNWDMETNEIELKKDKEKKDDSDTKLDLATSNFFSKRKSQDGLNFLSLDARFELSDKTLYCNEVEYIDVADARIYPDSMKVVVRENAEMDMLHNSTIVASYITKYHKIIDASTKITARRAYTSKGNYPYYDVDSNFFKIPIHTVYVDSSFQSIAEGKINDSDGFKLSPYFDYYGSVYMNASNPLLLFNGATRIQHKCEAFPQNWMSFSARLDSRNIQLPVDKELKTLEGKAISAGIVWHYSENMDSTFMYPTFLSEMISPDDTKMLTADGVLQYNQDSKEFEIATTSKLLNRAEKGNYISLHTESCSMNGDGVVNLGMDYSDVKIDAVGTVNYNQKKQETTANLTIRISTPMDESGLKDVAKSIVATPDLKPVDIKMTTLEQAAFEWGSRKIADKLVTDYTLKGEVKKLPTEMENTFVISGLKLRSLPKSQEYRGLVSIDEEAALIGLVGEPIMRTIPVQGAFYKTATGDRFGLNIEVPGGKTYFFSYEVRKKDGKMLIFSSDKEFEGKISSIKADKRKIKKFEYEVTENPTYLSTFKRTLK
jgi:hypothetical protein